MLTRHSLTDSTQIDISNSHIAELDIQFNGAIYTKTLYSTHTRVGKSIRNLSEFSIYSPGVEPGKYNLALLQFKLINNELKLTTTYPFISINELGNTQLDATTYEELPYLGISSDLKLTTLPRPEYHIPDLGDVQQLTLDAEHNGFVLATVTQELHTTKDPFTPVYYYTWALKPETTRLLTFDDTTKNNPLVPYQVLRSYLETEQRGVGVENTRFQIGYDSKPELSTSLNASSYPIYNQTYPTRYIQANKSLFTLDCDCNKYNLFVVHCTDVNILQVSFSYETDVTDNFIPISLLIDNFNGAIEFSNDVEFENGLPLALLGDSHIINCLIYNTGSTLKVRILQKATNLSKVPL